MKILKTKKGFQIEGDNFEFTLSVFPTPAGLPTITGESVEISNLSDAAAKAVENGRKFQMDIIGKRSAAEAESTARQAKVAAAKWTIIIGHRSRCAGLAQDDEVFFDTLTHGAGVIVSILEGGHDIKGEGDRRVVVHATSIEELIKVFDPKARINGNEIVTNNPGAIIGKQGRRIKFLSRAAGHRLNVN